MIIRNINGKDYNFAPMSASMWRLVPKIIISNIWREAQEIVKDCADAETKRIIIQERTACAKDITLQHLMKDAESAEPQYAADIAITVFYLALNKCDSTITQDIADDIVSQMPQDMIRPLLDELMAMPQGTTTPKKTS